MRLHRPGRGGRDRDRGAPRAGRPVTVFDGGDGTGRRGPRARGAERACHPRNRKISGCHPRRRRRRDLDFVVAGEGVLSTKNPAPPSYLTGLDYASVSLTARALGRSSPPACPVSQLLDAPTHRALACLHSRCVTPLYANATSIAARCRSRRERAAYDWYPASPRSARPLEHRAPIPRQRAGAATRCNRSACRRGGSARAADARRRWRGVARAPQREGHDDLRCTVRRRAVPRSLVAGTLRTHAGRMSVAGDTLPPPDGSMPVTDAPARVHVEGAGAGPRRRRACLGALRRRGARHRHPRAPGARRGGRGSGVDPLGRGGLPALDPARRHFASLAARFPDAGGVATFVRLAIGPTAARMAGYWFLFGVQFGAPVVATLGAEYVVAAIGADRAGCRRSRSRFCLPVRREPVRGAHQRRRAGPAEQPARGARRRVVIGGDPRDRADQLRAVHAERLVGRRPRDQPVRLGVRGVGGRDAPRVRVPNPRRTIPLATAIAIVIVGVAYLSLQVVTVGALGSGKPDSQVPLIDLVA